MKLESLILAAALAVPAGSMACTSLIAGRAATPDGSVLVPYAADSPPRYGER